jgi:hypothetical protein
MILNFIYKIITAKNLNFIEKVNELKKYYKYYQNFKNSFKQGTLYSNSKNQNQLHENFIKQIDSKDIELLNHIFNNDVKDWLKKMKIKENLEFNEKEDFLQVGIGTIFVEKPISMILTTGKAIFYLPFKDQKHSKIIIDCFGIAPLKATITCERSIKEFEIGMFSRKTIEIKVEELDIVDNILEISIVTNKLWFLNKILQSERSILVGIGINSIKIQ